jgi:streptogramin lyase
MPMLRIVALVGIAALVGSCTSSTNSPAAPALIASPSTTPSPVASQARTAVAQAVIPIGSGIISMAAGPTGIWVVTNSSVVRIDPRTNAVAMTFPLPESPDGYGLAVDAKALWVSDFDHNVVDRLDPATGTRIAAIPTPVGPDALLEVAGAVWVCDHRTGSVSRIDPNMNKVVQTISVGPTGYGGPGALAAVSNGLWVGFGFQPNVVRVDTRAGRATTTVTLPGDETAALIFDQTHVWARYSTDTAAGVAVLNTSGDGLATTIDVGGVPGDSVLLHDGVVWLPVLPHAAGGGFVVAIDPATDAIVDRLSIADGTPGGILDAFGSVWLENDLQGKIERLPETAFTVSR